ncbi:hypothetical protein [Metabacillus arenae]|uniref:Uncharacterized protein n=1 Tax=Metabacillus arenae TaxID=2771434 RepID=A0A926NGU9_9BACI|nr:hypothetical protein [Metabacillus arenae]MBD1383204.1 hypothetical protein [Metabacillus arenae]
MYSLFLLYIFLNGCSNEKFGVDFIVENEKGQPIEETVVDFNSSSAYINGKANLTDEYGKVTIILKEGNYTFGVRKDPGYPFQEFKRTITKNSKEIVLTLE